MSSLYRKTRFIGVMIIALALGAGFLAQATLGLAQEGGTVNMGPATPSSLGPAVPPEVTNNPNDWPMAMGDYAAHRSVKNSPINASSVGQLNPAWAFELPGVSAFGAVTAAPVVIGDTVYIQDMKSNVFALDRATGNVKWQQMFNGPTEGPNGVAVAYGMVFGSIGNTAEVFALDASNGQVVWRIRLSNNDQIGVDMVPTVYNNVVYVSTVPGNSQNFYQGGAEGHLLRDRCQDRLRALGVRHHDRQPLGQPGDQLRRRPLVSALHRRPGEHLFRHRQRRALAGHQGLSERLEPAG